MTIFFSACLLGLSTACVAWVMVHHFQSRAVLANRMTGVTDGYTFPYALPGQSLLGKNDDHSTITLDESYADKTARQLFLAGFRSQKTVRFYANLKRLSLILPFGLILLYLLTNSLTIKNFISSWALGAMFYFYVHFLLIKLKQKRQRSILRDLPQFFDLLVVCIESGLNFTAALPRVIQELDPKAPLIREFNTMHYEFLGGLSLTQACDRLSRRCEVPDLSVILNSVVQSEQMGSALANTLRIQSEELRDKQRQRMRERAHQIPIKILFPMMLIFITLFIMTLGPAGTKLNFEKYADNIRTEAAGATR